MPGAYHPGGTHGFPHKRKRSGPKSKSSPYLGVTQYKRTGRFEAHIWIFEARGAKGHQRHLGSYDSAAAPRLSPMAAVAAELRALQHLACPATDAAILPSTVVGSGVAYLAAGARGRGAVLVGTPLQDLAWSAADAEEVGSPLIMLDDGGVGAGWDLGVY
ncbi:hypothetical protein ACKKBG_A14640 [Auxenochlorella protothecoides x Auxenochlorella symbiontica]